MSRLKSSKNTSHIVKTTSRCQLDVQEDLGHSNFPEQTL